MKKVVLVGRTNVGKSTFFNRLCRKKSAIVHDRPGVTRDRKEGIGFLDNLTFQVVDTAGLEKTSSLAQSMWEQTEQALNQADLIWMIVDARTEINPLDIDLAQRLRTLNKPVILLANKCEGKQTEENLFQFYQLGLGEALGISAEHGLGMHDLYSLSKDFIQEGENNENIVSEKRTRKRKKDKDSELEENNDTDENLSRQDTLVDNRPIRLAIVGRPNVGKSTLINQILKQDRLLTGPEAGVTRDAIEIPFEYGGKDFILIDTAGLRKRTAITDSLEKMSTSHTTNAIDFASVVVLILDATVPMERQDINIAVKTLKEGRPLIIALNKSDLVKDKKSVINQLEEKLSTSLQQAKGTPIILTSGKNGFGIDSLFKTVLDIYEKWNKRVSTHKVNLFLAKMTEAHLPPIAQNGRHIPLKYMTQVNTRPPSFVIFTSNPTELPESYMRYLTNGLRREFGFEGVPLRLTLKKQKNPYSKKK